MKLKLYKCPFCGGELTDSKSIEHIIPESLGNTTLILDKGIICDKCNNYFARKIENDFLNLEVIKAIRSNSFIPNKNNNIPPMTVFVNGSKAKFEYNAKKDVFLLGCEPEAAYNIFKGNTDKMMFVVPSIEELKNNYIVSRFLMKVFTEYLLLLHLEYETSINENEREFNIIKEKEIEELFHYVRYGKQGKVYNYSAELMKKIVPFNVDKEYIQLEYLFDEEKGIYGMKMKLLYILFVLYIN